MAFPVLPILSGLGSALSSGAGSESNTDSSFVSHTTGSSTIKRTEFNKKTLKALEALFSKSGLLKNQAIGNEAIDAQLSRVNDAASTPFDIQKFVTGIMTQAGNTIGNQAGESINLAESDIGGTQGNNSMTALLGSKIATDSAAQLAGIESEATARGTEIAKGQQQADTESILGLIGQRNKGLTDFLQLLRGARTNQKQKTKEHTEGSSTSSTSSPFNPMEAIGGFLGSFKAPT